MPQTDNQKHNAYIDFTIFIFPLVFTLACVVLYKIFQPTYNAFAGSTFAYGIKVYYTFLAFTCSLLCLFIAVKLYKKRLLFHFTIYFIFFISLFFLFLEMIHYGQKIYSPQTSESPLALHELTQMRFFLDLTFFFLGFYCSFYWIRFAKTPQALKFSTARLFVPDFSLMFYFFPIVIFFIIANYLEYITHLAIITDFTSVIKRHAWLFELNRFFPHYSRILLSMGLFIFFLKSAIWIKKGGDLQNKANIFSLKKLLLIYLLVVSCIFAFGHKLFPERADLGWGKYFEINNDFEGAILHYNLCIKKDDNAYVHKALFLLYNRLKKDDLAIQHLSQAIKKSTTSGNQEMATELYKTAFTFYPNSTIDPETRSIYFQK